MDVTKLEPLNAVPPIEELTTIWITFDTISNFPEEIIKTEPLSGHPLQELQSPIHVLNDEELVIGDIVHSIEVTKLETSDIDSFAASLEEPHSLKQQPSDRKFAVEKLTETKPNRVVKKKKLIGPRSIKSKTHPELKSVKKESVGAAKNKVKQRKSFKCCVFCGMGMPSLRIMESHLRAHIGESIFFCKYCPREFSRLNKVLSHQVWHEDQRPFVCNQCPSAYKAKFDLDKHIRREHYHIKPHVCEFCGRAFAKLSDKDSHIRIHTRERIHKCKLCDKSFTAANSYRRHMKLHSENRQWFECDVCKARLSTKRILETHMEGHSGERTRSFKCDLCPKAFYTVYMLREHIRTHTGEKQFKCDICHRSFRCKSDVEVHTRNVHFKVQGNFQCLFCDKYFHKPTALELHVLGHIKERPCFCSVCGLEYSSPYTLRFHMEIHSTNNNPVKPYPCLECNKAFRTNFNLSLHTRRVHPDPVFFDLKDLDM